MANTNKQFHLSLVQGVITRLATNSFQIKGWSVLLTASLFALASVDSHPEFVFLAYIPAITFWILDSYYLSQERLYRELFNELRSLKEEGINFSMDTSAYKHKKNTKWVDAFFSKTILMFHATLILTIFIVMMLFFITKNG